MKTYRIGIFGGVRGMAYYEPLLADPRVQVTAVCETRPKIIEQVKEKIHEGTQLYSDPMVMIESGNLDCIVLANYFHEHGKYAIAAMKAGLDVISDTTAAPTLGECVDLVETAEQTGKKYFLAANCPVMPGAAELKRVYEKGELGEVFYAEGEYLHGMVLDEPDPFWLSISEGDQHWRRYLPGVAYNMHSLGVLMELTGLRPKRVTATDIDMGNLGGNSFKKNRCVGGVGLYEMESGAIFRSTGCCSFGPDGKWYRLSCRYGTVETVRVDETKVLYRKTGEDPVEYDPDTKYADWEKNSGHGGADGRICRKALSYLLDGEKVFFDVYNAASLSAAGICGLYSVIDGKSYDIPDFHNPADRDAVRGDYRTPFPDEHAEATLPCNRRLAQEANFRVDENKPRVFPCVIDPE